MSDGFGWLVFPSYQLEENYCNWLLAWSLFSFEEIFRKQSREFYILSWQKSRYGLSNESLIAWFVIYTELHAYYLLNVYQVCVELFFTSKIHIECQTWTHHRPKSPSVISSISGQTSTLYIWLCPSLVLQSGKTPGVMLVVWMLYFNFGSFFRLLCDWLESVQCCLLRIHLMLFLFVEAWYTFGHCKTALWLPSAVSIPSGSSSSFRTSFHSSRHLTRCGDVSKKVRVQAWSTDVPAVTQEERKERSSA